MIRPALATALALASIACEPSVIRIGAADSIESRQAASQISKRLGKAGRAAHVVACGAQRECAKALLSSDLELVVLDDEAAALVADGGGQIPTGFVRSPRLWVRASNPLSSIDQLAALSRRELNIAISPDDRVRVNGGVATLIRSYGLVGVKTFVDASVTTRFHCLESRECDAVMATSAEVVGNYRALVDQRGALSDSALTVVVRGGEREIDSDTHSAISKLAPTPNALPVLELVVGTGVDAADTFNLVALVLREHQLTQVTPESKAPGDVARLWLEPEASASSESREAIVAFDDGRGASLVLSQEPDGVVDREIAERLLASPSARMPAPRSASVWHRKGEAKPREDASRPWLDSLINVAVLAFLIWLVVIVVRRRETTDVES